MKTVLQALREVIGTPDFYVENGNYSSTWDYGVMIEYAIAGILVMLVVSYIFRMIKWMFTR